MTTGTCIYCGELKFGAFVACMKCGRVPQRREHVITSLALTDHYFSVDDLERFGVQLKTGTPITIDAQVLENIAAQIDDQTLATLTKLADREYREKSRTKERRMLLFIGAVLIGWIVWMIYRFAMT